MWKVISLILYSNRLLTSQLFYCACALALFFGFIISYKIKLIMLLMYTAVSKKMSCDINMAIYWIFNSLIIQ